MPDLVTLCDDDGKNYTFEVLDAYEEDNVQYAALTPYFEGETDDNTCDLPDDGSIIVMRVVQEDGEQYFEDIDDDDLYSHIASIMMSRLQDYLEVDDE